MTHLFRRHTLSLTAVGLILLSLQLMNVSIRYPAFPRSGARIVGSILHPVEKLLHEMVQTSRFYWTHYVWLVDVEKDREVLRDRVRELEARNTRLLEFENENQRLKALLEFKNSTELTGIVSSVIGRDQSNWVKSLTIDRGLSSGVRPGLSVVDGHAVVGQVISATENSAKVLLLVDTTSALDALIQESRISGIIEGGIDSTHLKLNYVIKDPANNIQVGDRVITSGLDGVYAKGVLIGVVERVKADAAGLFQDVMVKPTVNFDRLESVLVIVPKEIPAKDQGATLKDSSEKGPTASLSGGPAPGKGEPVKISNAKIVDEKIARLRATPGGQS